MSRPLDRLVGMGLVRREVPFGESEKKSRRSLYKIGDPFFRLWFRVVAPNRATLATNPLLALRAVGSSARKKPGIPMVIDPTSVR